MIETLLMKQRQASGGITEPYHYWRFNLTQHRTQAITVPEIRLMDDAGNVITSGYSANATASSRYSVALGAPKAFDGIVPVSKDDASHWQANNNSSTSWLQIWVPTPRAIAEYRIYVPRDSKYPVSETFPYYAPSGWTLIAALEGGPWVTIDTKSGYTMEKWLTKEEHQFIL